MYENEKNPSRVFEICEHLFEFKQGNRSVSEFYSEVKGLIDELEMHQPSVTDATTLRGYRQDLAVKVFIWLEPHFTIPNARSDSRRWYSHIDCHFLESYASIYWG